MFSLKGWIFLFALASLSLLPPGSMVTCISRARDAPDTSYISNLARIVKVLLSRQDNYRESLQLPIVLRDKFNVDRWTVSSVQFNGVSDATFEPASRVGGYVSPDSSFCNFYANYVVPNFSVNGSIDGTGHLFAFKDTIDLRVFANVTYAQYWAKGIVNGFDLTFDPPTYRVEVICSSANLKSQCDSISRMLDTSQLGHNSLKELLMLKLRRRILMEFTPILNL